MNKLKWLVFCSFILALSLSGLAQKTGKNKAAKKAVKTEVSAEKFLAKGDGIESCAVTGEKLESKNISGQFYGRTVYFCCDDCLAAAKKNPAQYVKKTEAEQLAAVKNVMAKEEKPHHHGDSPVSETAKFLGKGDGIETCPVTGEKIDKSVSFEVQGRTVYACCPGCIEKVKKNPELYLKWATAEK